MEDEPEEGTRARQILKLWRNVCIKRGYTPHEARLAAMCLLADVALNMVDPSGLYEDGHSEVSSEVHLESKDGPREVEVTVTCKLVKKAN